MKIQLPYVNREARGERGIFHLVPQLSSPEREINFLRLVAELLVSRCLPPEYSRCTPLRTLLKELLACKGVFSFRSLLFTVFFQHITMCLYLPLCLNFTLKIDVLVPFHVSQDYFLHCSVWAHDRPCLWPRLDQPKVSIIPEATASSWGATPPHLHVCSQLRGLHHLDPWLDWYPRLGTLEVTQSQSPWLLDAF